MSLRARNRGQTPLVVHAIHLAALSMWLVWQDGIRLPGRRDDRGALTTEQAIITAALIGLATVLVTAITLAVGADLAKIK